MYKALNVYGENQLCHCWKESNTDGILEESTKQNSTDCFFCNIFIMNKYMKSWTN